MGTLFIVRHGETVWNQEDRIQGHTDVALSERGMQQARSLRDRLADAPLDAAYTSDLQRAAATAEIVLGEREVPLNATPLLREYQKGAHEGLTFEEIRARFPQQLPAYLTKDLDFAPTGGESARAVSARMGGIIRKIARKHLDETVLVVGHGGSLRAAMQALLGMGLDANFRFAFGNCTLTIVDTYADNAVLRLFNDGSHLNGLGQAD